MNEGTEGKTDEHNYNLGKISGSNHDSNEARGANPIIAEAVTMRTTKTSVSARTATQEQRSGRFNSRPPGNWSPSYFFLRVSFVQNEVSQTLC